MSRPVPAFAIAAVCATLVVLAVFHTALLGGRDAGAPLAERSPADRAFDGPGASVPPTGLDVPLAPPPVPALPPARHPPARTSSQSLLQGRLVGPAREGDVLSIRAGGDPPRYLRVSKHQTTFSFGPLRCGTDVRLSYAGSCGMLSSPVTLRSLQPGVTSVVLVLEPSRVLDLWTTSDGPTKTEPVHAFVHRAVQRPTTAGVEVYPRHRARVLGPRHLRLAGLEERSASGRLWTRDGRLLEFHDLPTAPAGLQTRATAAWRGPGAVTVDIVRPDALSHAVLHVLIADRAYGLSAASAAARTDMGRRGARAAFRDLPPETRCRFAALWPADYDLFLLDDHGVVLAVGACRVRSGGQTLCTLSCGRGTLLRVRNTASGKPRGFALISARQGILMRRTVPPGKQVEVGWLPQGRYQLRGWTKDSGIRPACLELDLGSTPARTVELPLR